MKELTFADLTLDFLKELKTLGTAEEIVDACSKRDFEISADNAAKLLEQFKKADELSKESIDDVAGGRHYFNGTKKLFGFIRRHSAACAWDCPEDCWADNCGGGGAVDYDGNGIDDFYECSEDWDGDGEFGYWDQLMRS